jgi:hypothetical protein
MTFQSAISSWRDFYGIVGTVSATLVGLLFVGLSLHLRAVSSRSEVKGLARVTLTNFALLLLVALFLSIPEDAASANVELLAVGIISILVSVPSLTAAARSPTRTLGILHLTLRFGLSILSYVAVFVAGVFIGVGNFSVALNSLVAVSVALLVISLRNSWDLLIELAPVTLSSETGAPGRHHDQELKPVKPEEPGASVTPSKDPVSR